ncbi:polymorphic toxin type 44 domain-containing protein [Cohnella sp. REN36]|uniref:polymorphic toxin type 44 domain-containing protein n=1 Tax=Cohnella sp. REN36 TaxID=2887347 RepID=UPI001D1478B4|nr:polymorphic toxin type 44 domain-containing protein [Cohnella sp. REN36]MCC3372449.1 polymorphic toxin type 44 domain-containing protein [Cohnella sp. REN36]
MFKRIIPIVVAGCLLLTSFVSASPSQNVNNISEVQKVHRSVVQKNLAILNEEGQIVVNANADDLGISETLFDEYMGYMQSVNYCVKEGIASFGKDLEVNMSSPEEYVEYLENKPQYKIQDNLIVVSPFSDPAAPPKNVIALARLDRALLEEFYAETLRAYLYAGSTSPATLAYGAAVGYFIDKVKPGGAWDYKVVAGYSPWYTTFTCTFLNAVEIQNSAYIGNYVYGYTGRYLFSQTILLAGGDGVSIITGKKPDGEDDKAPIRRGYSEAGT